MDINIVGILTDIDEINEILELTEVFLIEDRLKELTFSDNSNNTTNDKVETSPNCIKINKKHFRENLQILTVKGLI